MTLVGHVYITIVRGNDRNRTAATKRMHTPPATSAFFDMMNLIGFGNQRTFNNSTTNVSTAFAGIVPGTPRDP